MIFDKLRIAFLADLLYESEYLSITAIREYIENENAESERRRTAVIIPETMKGVHLIGHGGPEKLVWNDAIPTPRPGPGGGSSPRPTGPRDGPGVRPRAPSRRWQ